MKKQVVIDTNFFLIPGRYKKDVLGELEQQGFQLVLLDCVLAELEKLALKRTQAALAAKIALQLIKQKGLNTVPGSKQYTDGAVLAYARQSGAAVATQDAELRRALRKASVRVVTFSRSGKLTTEDTDVLQAQGTGPHSRPARPVR